MAYNVSAVGEAAAPWSTSHPAHIAALQRQTTFAHKKAAGLCVSRQRRVGRSCAVPPSSISYGQCSRHNSSHSIGRLITLMMISPTFGIPAVMS